MVASFQMLIKLRSCLCLVFKLSSKLQSLVRFNCVLRWRWLLCPSRSVRRFLITFLQDLIDSLCILLAIPSSWKTGELKTAALSIDCCCCFIQESSPVGHDCCHLVLGRGITSLCLCRPTAWHRTDTGMVDWVDEWISTLTDHVSNCDCKSFKPTKKSG